MPPPHQVTLSKQWGYWSHGGYELNNNTWGQHQATGGSQVTHYDGPSGPGIAWSSDWEWHGGEHEVKSYVYGARQFQRRLVDQIQSLPTSASWRYNTGNIRGNVAYDIFTDPDPNHANSSGEFEVMIWLAVFGGVWPISEAKRPLARINICGYDWDVFFGYNHGGKMKVYSFLPAWGPIYDFNADVKFFFNYLIDYFKFPAHNQYMLVYQLGTEAFTGGPATFEVPKFIADVH